ncbi:MAG: S1C family serine protease [Candidatus Dormibacteria bacterium]
MNHAVRRNQRLLAAVVLAACIGLVGGALAAWAIYARFGPVERVITQTAPQAGSSGGGGAPSVAQIAQQASASVIEIATHPVNAQQLLSGGSGLVDGFAVSADGLIVTSVYALHGATALNVATPDGHLYPATIVRADAAHGVALLRATGAQGLTPLNFAATAPAVGDLAIAVGRAPFSQLTLSTGTVSSTGRDVTLNDGEPAIIDALTVDATPDPREDGAPLLSGNGAVIGVMVDAGSSTPGLVALSGRAASTLVKAAGGGGAAPTLGIDSIVLDSATAAAAGVPPGALIRSLDPSGPGAQAGLVPGDVVTTVNGATIDSAHPLDPVALGLTPTQQITMTVFAAGATRSITLTVSSTSPTGG